MRALVFRVVAEHGAMANRCTGCDIHHTPCKSLLNISRLILLRVLALCVARL
jgi:hypothetical protein